MQNDISMEQKIKQYEAQMPPEIMNLIKSFDWKKEVRMIVNQNQLLLDVGADLEESVYLMILGIVEIGEVFERLMDVHELPEDKAQKILTEVERQIFDPMHKKLLEVSPEESNTVVSQSVPAPVVTPTVSSVAISTPSSAPVKPLDTRDEILSEIEKEPEPVVKKTPPVIDLTHSKELSSKSPSIQAGPIEPFSLSKEMSDTMNIDEPVIDIPPASPEEKDPIELNLTQNTVVEANKPLVSSAPTKSYVADPYREPIE